MDEPPTEFIEEERLVRLLEGVVNGGEEVMGAMIDATGERVAADQVFVQLKHALAVDIEGRRIRLFLTPDGLMEMSWDIKREAEGDSPEARREQFRLIKGGGKDET